MIVSVDLDHGPTKGTPLVREWLKLQRLGDRREALKPVVVHDGHEVVEPMVRGEEDCLPIRAFVAFAEPVESSTPGIPLCET